MDINFLIRGIAAGFLIAAPVGPVNMLCMRRTLTDGRRAGFISGLGAATADAIYGAIAAFGVKFISNILFDQQEWLRLAGGLFICALGVKTFLTIPPDPAAKGGRSNHAGAYASTFFLTLTNPTTIISFGAVFAWLGLANAHANYIAAEILVLGVFLGSALWWLILALGVGLFRTKYTRSNMRWVNRISGVAITAFGLIALLWLGT